MEDKPIDLDEEIRVLQNHIGSEKLRLKLIQSQLETMKAEEKLEAEYLEEQQEKLKSLRELKKEIENGNC